jgi:hypothetical protein
VPLYGAPIWPLVTLVCLCGWLVSLVGTSRWATSPLEKSAYWPSVTS